MSYTPPTTRSTGELITGSIWNTDIVDNIIALRTGAIAIASQANLDLITGASGTQLARVAAGAALTVPRINGSGNAWEFVAASSIAGATKLYAANVAVSTSIGVPSNLDTFAISGLTALDRLLVTVQGNAAEGNTSYLYHVTGTTTLSTAIAGEEMIVAVLGRSANNANIIQAITIVGGVLAFAAPNPGVAWTGSFTIAIRDDNAGAGGTKHTNWGIWKLNG